MSILCFVDIAIIAIVRYEPFPVLIWRGNAGTNMINLNLVAFIPMICIGVYCIHGIIKNWRKRKELLKAFD